MRLTMLRRNLRKKCHKQGEASSENPEAAEHAHRSPQLTHLPWRLAIGVRVLTIPTKKGEHHQASCLVRAGLASSGVKRPTQSTAAESPESPQFRPSAKSPNTPRP